MAVAYWLADDTRMSSLVNKQSGGWDQQENICDAIGGKCIGEAAQTIFNFICHLTVGNFPTGWNTSQNIVINCFLSISL